MPVREKMFASNRINSAQLEKLEQIKSWTRERFNMSDDAVIMVAEVNCKIPGCPPVETVVAFWNDENLRYRFKLFTPVAEVCREDLPISWLLPALIDYGDLGCDCC